MSKTNMDVVMTFHQNDENQRDNEKRPARIEFSNGDYDNSINIYNTRPFALQLNRITNN